MIETEYWVTGILTAVVVRICVLVHYEGLRLLSDRLPMRRIHDRNPGNYRAYDDHLVRVLHVPRNDENLEQR